MRQKLILDMMIRRNPVIQELVDRLGLEIQHNPRRDAEVSSKVQELASAAKLRPRMIHRSSPFQTDQEINLYLELIYGPRPWKTPLASAPF